MADQYLPSDQQDAQTAFRLFANLYSAALGTTPDQNYSSEDAYLGNATGQFTVNDPYRGAAVQGKAYNVSGLSAQKTTGPAAAVGLTPGMVLGIVAVAFLVLH